MKDLRKIEVLKNNKWQEINFEHLHKGDIFRMFESTGEPVVDNKGNRHFKAVSEPYMTPDGVLGIDVQ